MEMEKAMEKEKERAMVKKMISFKTTNAKPPAGGFCVFIDCSL